MTYHCVQRPTETMFEHNRKKYIYKEEAGYDTFSQHDSLASSIHRVCFYIPDICALNLFGQETEEKGMLCQSEILLSIKLK